MIVSDHMKTRLFSRTFNPNILDELTSTLRTFSIPPTGFTTFHTPLDKTSAPRISQLLIPGKGRRFLLFSVAQTYRVVFPIVSFPIACNFGGLHLSMLRNSHPVQLERKCLLLFLFDKSQVALTLEFSHVGWGAF